MRAGSTTLETETQANGEWGLNVELGDTWMFIEFSTTLLLLTQGTAETNMVVTGRQATFPAIGMQPVSTTLTASSTTTASVTVPTTAGPTPEPTAGPTALTTVEPTPEPTDGPTALPSTFPTTPGPAAEPTEEPTAFPTTADPTAEPTAQPTTPQPVAVPTSRPFLEAVMFARSLGLTSANEWQQ